MDEEYISAVALARMAYSEWVAVVCSNMGRIRGIPFTQKRNQCYSSALLRRLQGSIIWWGVGRAPVRHCNQ